MPTQVRYRATDRRDRHHRPRLHRAGRRVLRVLSGGRGPYAVALSDNGITARYLGGDTGTLRLFSQPADHREPRDIATALLEGVIRMPGSPT